MMSSATVQACGAVRSATSPVSRWRTGFQSHGLALMNWWRPCAAAGGKGFVSAMRRGVFLPDAWIRAHRYAWAQRRCSGRRNARKISSMNVRMHAPSPGIAARTSVDDMKRYAPSILVIARTRVDTWHISTG